MTEPVDSRPSAGEPGLDSALTWISERFRSLVELLPAVVYEAEPGPEGRFHYVSPEIEQLLGYTAEEWGADPRLWLDRLHPDDREETVRREREHARYARGRDIRMRAEYRMVARDGRVVVIRDEARLLREGRGPWLWRGLWLDATASVHVPPVPAPKGDALRLSCRKCGASWAAERREACPECGNPDVSGVSLQATLTALASTKHRTERLVDGLHDHLDDLGSLLRDSRGRPQSRDP